MLSCLEIVLQIQEGKFLLVQKEFHYQGQHVLGIVDVLSLVPALHPPSGAVQPSSQRDVAAGTAELWAVPFSK